MDFTNFAQNWENTLQSFEYMGKGLLGIFAVTLLIIGSIWVLNKVTSISFKKSDGNDAE